MQTSDRKTDSRSGEITSVRNTETPSSSGCFFVDPADSGVNRELVWAYEYGNVTPAVAWLEGRGHIASIGRHSNKNASYFRPYMHNYIGPDFQTLTDAEAHVEIVWKLKR